MTALRVCCLSLVVTIMPVAQSERVDAGDLLGLTFRGNTLADSQPRSTTDGYQLYADLSLEALRAPANSRKAERFVRAKPRNMVTE
jgi:hypothetical protein